VNERLAGLMARIAVERLQTERQLEKTLEFKISDWNGNKDKVILGCSNCKLRDLPVP
jgi:hypothetical protein